MGSQQYGLPAMVGVADGPAHASSKAIPLAVYVFAGCAALNSVCLGFDVGINSAVGPSLKEDLSLNDVELEIFIGSLDFFSIFGAMFASTISDRLGRRKAFAVAAIAFEVGVVGLVTSTSYNWLMLGRGFLGFGVGFGLAADPVYIAEIAPPKRRGELVTWSELGINVGILLGFIVGYCFADLPAGMAWRAMFGVGMLLPIVMLALVKFVMPESPRWLILKGRYDEAADVIRLVNHPGVSVQQVMDEIRLGIAAEFAVTAKVSWRTVLCPSPAVKRMLVVAVGVGVSQQLSGIDPVLYFLVFVLREAGIRDTSSQFGFMILLGCLKLLMIPIAGRLFDKYGRRPLMLASCVSMIAALLLMSVSFFAGGIPALALTALIGYMCAFSVGMGPGAWLIPSEVLATSIRAKGMTLVTIANRVTATILASSVLSLANLLSWGGFFLFLALLVFLITIFIYTTLPETKGRSLEELTEYFCQITEDKAEFLSEFANQPAELASESFDFEICEDQSPNAAPSPARVRVKSPTAASFPAQAVVFGKSELELAEQEQQSRA
ncbi:unnamed protein product [Polarella glacialis]|uniref:Hexose transporter 1 n=1 Tax=Polarella glacialis TaxID=89957 RepID=A0A813M073_POLGL|nr:unnamed protein product [Polarella glacialis]